MDETLESIKTLWMQGLTGGQISKQLNITRSAVLGKIYRMREAGQIDVRESDQRAKNIRDEVKRLEKERQLSFPDIVRDTPVERDFSPPKQVYVCEPIPPHPFLFEEMAPNDPEWKPVSFDELTPKSCRFVLNDGPPSQFLFCGKKKVGRAYCADHEKLCYYFLTKRVEKQ